jgi:hypothetical protein
MSKRPKNALITPCLLGILALVPAGMAGIDVPGMDRSVKPGDDFYAYANGGWMKATEIPPDRSSVGSFSIVEEMVTQRTAALLQEASKAGQPADSDAAKAGVFYQAYMNEKAIEMGLRAVEGGARRDRGDRRPRRAGPSWEASWRRRRRPQQHELPHRPSLRSPGGAGVREPDRRRVSASGRARCSTATTTPTPIRTVDLQGSTASTSPRSSGLRRLRTDARALRIYALEAHRRDVVSRTDSVDVHKANNPWKPSTSRRRRRVSTGRPTSPRPASPGSP